MANENFLADLAATARQLLSVLSESLSMGDEADMMSFLDLMVEVEVEQPKSKSKSKSNQLNLKLETETKITQGWCSIGLEEFIEEDICRRLVNCTHLFHNHCVSQWLQKQPSCPLCRTKIKIQNMALW